MTLAAHKETLEFQTEVKQLLHLMIHSLYSNKEIFLRELISNASDAADKLRFEALTDATLYEDDSELKITVDYDAKQQTVTVTDNGIGMSREEVIEHIGTIAKSGTRQFLQTLTGDQAQDAHLIGQFGVGFYSSFIVADKVTLKTRRAGAAADSGVLWESDGGGSYTLEALERQERGTEVTLHLRKEEDEFLHSARLQSIIHKYSDHIAMPILMRKEGEDADSAAYETVNQASALWARSKKDISVEQYNEFYKHVAHDFEEPLAYVHNRVEGRQSYTSLLFIPKRAPFDLWDRDTRHGIKLYVRRVFIMDDAEQLIPRYLRFVRGVIDSDDLPLNISREILQQNRIIDTLRAASVKRVLDVLEDMADKDKDKYKDFWREFGRVLKEGPAEDYANRERIAKLLRFASTHGGTDAQDVALDDYVRRMKFGQEKIYYLSADSYAAAASSPHLEIFRKKNIEVLLLTDRVDEWLVAHLSEYDKKPLHSVAKGELDLGKLEDEEDRNASKKAEPEFKDLIERMQKVLGDKIKEVRASSRLTDSPACLVLQEHDMAVHLQRLMKEAGHALPAAKPILEINLTHPLVAGLKDADEPHLTAMTEVLFAQAVLGAGGQLDDPATFVKRINELLAVRA